MIFAQVFYQAPHALPLVIGVAAAALIAVLWLYPVQARSVVGKSRWFLLFLRASAMAALAVALLKPVLVRPRTALERGVVVVLVDRSASMGVIDNARTPDQLVALADGLGKLPAGVRQDVASDLKLALERLRPLVDNIAAAREDLYFARLSGTGIDPARQRTAGAISQFVKSLEALSASSAKLNDPALHSALAAIPIPNDAGPSTAPSTAPTPTEPNDSESRTAWAGKARGAIEAASTVVTSAQIAADLRLYQSNPQVHQACDELSRLSRIQLLDGALLDPLHGLLGAIGPQNPVDAFTVGDDLVPLALHLDSKATTHPTSAPSPSLRVLADAKRSELSGGVADAIARTAGKSVRAVVLFSDGHSIGPAGGSSAGRSASGGPPVFTVSVAPARAARDVSFAAVSFPPSIFAGESLNIHVELHAESMPGVVTNLHCTAGGTEQTRAVKLPEVNSQSVGADFSVKLSESGPKQLKLWFDPVPGEATDLNNSVERWVKVLPDRMRVAAIAGAPTWDFQYVRNALERKTWLDVDSEILPPVNAKLLMPARQLLDQDVVVLSDVPVSALDDAQWDSVVSVARRGGSVILLAGPEHLPDEYSQRAATLQLLPYRAEGYSPVWRVWPGEAPYFRFVPTAEGPARDALRLNDSAAADRWLELPPVFSFLEIPASELKTYAVSLAVEVESRAAGTSDKPNPLALLTEMRLGLGRVFFFGCQETWRWRTKVGERDQDRFWIQLMRYAAEDPYAVRTTSVAMDLDKVSAEPGEPVGVRVRLADESADPADFRVEVVQNNAVVLARKLPAPVSGGSGRYRLTLPGLPPGQFSVQLAGPGIPLTSATRPSTSPSTAPSGSVQIPLRIASTDEAELADVSPDPEFLRRMAESSGGEFLTLDQLRRLPDRLAAITEERLRYVELPLWHGPVLFAFVIGCLAAEWALRKRLGLA